MEQVTIRINGRAITVAQGTTVAAAVAEAGQFKFRNSTTGRARGPLCGMGICSECTLTIDGQPECRSCLILCEQGMEVTTDG